MLLYRDLKCSVVNSLNSPEVVECGIMDFFLINEYNMIDLKGHIVLQSSVLNRESKIAEMTRSFPHIYESTKQISNFQFYNT